MQATNLVQLSKIKEGRFGSEIKPNQLKTQKPHPSKQ